MFLWVCARLFQTSFLCLHLPCYALSLEKKLNRGAGLGLEIPVMYQVRGHEKALQWLEKTITKIFLHADDLGSKFKSKQFLRNIYFLNK